MTLKRTCKVGKIGLKSNYHWSFKRFFLTMSPSFQFHICRCYITPTYNKICCNNALHWKIICTMKQHVYKTNIQACFSKWIWTKQFIINTVKIFGKIFFSICKFLFKNLVIRFFDFLQWSILNQFHSADWYGFWLANPIVDFDWRENWLKGDFYIIERGEIDDSHWNQSLYTAIHHWAI